MTLNFHSYPILAPLDNIKVSYAGGVVAVIAVLAILYKNSSLATSSKNGLPLPPGPPAHWFWSNALPTVKSVLEI